MSRVPPLFSSLRPQPAGAICSLFRAVLFFAVLCVAYSVAPPAFAASPDYLRQALANRQDATHEDELSRTKLLMAEAFDEKGDSQEWNGWKMAAIAPPDSSYYGQAWDYDNGEPFLQEGLCPRCQTQLRGHAKISLCAICGTRIVLT